MSGLVFVGPLSQSSLKYNVFVVVTAAAAMATTTTATVKLSIGVVLRSKERRAKGLVEMRSSRNSMVSLGTVWYGAARYGTVRCNG